MVKLLFIFSLAALTAAIPAPDTTSDPQLIHSDFSFEKWVDDIMANPDTALTVDQALAAHNATIHARGLVGRQSGVNCDKLTRKRAKGPAAVWCINHLARRGHNGDKCSAGCSGVTNCQHGQCEIVSQTGRCGDRKVNCNAVARTAGAVMDKCFRADQTVAGNAYGPRPNDWMYVHLQGGD
ncbi:hypothetical protein BU26DRAFT_565496 [Trematosphaeria pertusa]|uniref:Secreted protein n=1 Tax=Trematosphaeria pertusa TaxID=390896 RepID=A0A6A6IEW5_9PLEO|nr:uncharacterized protein BU26DRAFT_565496 [Trematosphaeria pertusa]KAF2248080.1 hypothetical protein BU26DRAFT_565496 [Trematosphaeria pertusa]